MLRVEVCCGCVEAIGKGDEFGACAFDDGDGD